MRIKLLRNKREVVVKQMRREIALLLHSGHDTTARIRVFLLFISDSFWVAIRVYYVKSACLDVREGLISLNYKLRSCLGFE